MVLDGDPVPGGGRIDLRTGEVWPQVAIDNAIQVAEIGGDADDPDRWLWVRCAGSRAGHPDDPGVADRPRIAIRGRGAFRRFKDTLSAWPELLARWFTVAEDRQHGRARA